MTRARALRERTVARGDARRERDSRKATASRSTTATRPRWTAVLGGLVAFALLHLLFTHANRVSTFAVEPRARLSVELFALVALLALWKSLGRGLPRWALALGGAALAAAGLIRYVDVTAPGVLGRRFDLHADLPHVGNVAAMFLDTLTPLSALGLVVAVLAAVALSVVVCALALALVARTLDDRRLRPFALLLGLAVVLLYFTVGRGPTVDAAPAEAVDAEDGWDPWIGRVERASDDGGLFAEPVASVVARQLGSLHRGAGELRLRPAPPSNLRGLENASGEPAHVVLVFLESYGVTLLDDPQHFPGIEPTFRSLERRLGDAGWAMRSVRAVSPTFGGGSWRAHATLMSGIWIDNERLYDGLLDSTGRALPHLLAEHGYRTVAAEPGIREAWPEARWYDFDRIYDVAGLDYPGPEIGWWRVPDQYTLYKIWRDELRDAERPVFAKLSLILSHIPYKPIPPVVEDWASFDDGSAYATALPSVAHDDYRDLDELSSRYVEAFRYELESLGKWLLELVPENTLVIVSGDHQPPKLATHANDSWDVPLHLFSRRPELVEAFAEHGFAPGLLPPATARLPMDAFLPAFLENFHRPSARETAP